MSASQNEEALDSVVTDQNLHQKLVEVALITTTTPTQHMLSANNQRRRRKGDSSSDFSLVKSRPIMTSIITIDLGGILCCITETFFILTLKIQSIQLIGNYCTLRYTFHRNYQIISIDYTSRQSLDLMVKLWLILLLASRYMRILQQYID